MSGQENRPFILEKVCRSCLSENAEMQSLFSELELEGLQARVSTMLMACTSVQISSGDGLPTLICTPCVHQLSNAFVFKRQCESSDVKLRQYLKLPPTPKKESIKENNPHHNIKLEKDQNDSYNIVIKPDLDLINEHASKYQDIDEGNDYENDKPFDENDDSRIEEKDEDDIEMDGKMKKHRKKSKKSFPCKYCERKLNSRAGYTLHLRKHKAQGDKKVYRCGECDEIFEKSSHLARHECSGMKQNNENHHEHEQYSTDTIENDSTLKNNSENEIEEEEDQNQNNINDLTSSMEHEMIEGAQDLNSQVGQLKMATEELLKALDFKEPIEPIESTNSQSVAPLLLKKIKSEQTYECEHCHKLLSTFNGLKIHRRRHTGKDLSTCSVCEKTFTKSSHLKRHLVSHGFPKEIKQEKDNNAISIPNAVGGVLTVNETKLKARYQCEFCDRKFVYRKSYSHHMLTEHAIISDDDEDIKPNIEELMQQEIEINENGVLKSEIELKVENDEDGEEFECHVCKHKFPRSNHLTRHMTLHRNVLTHKCPRCEKAYLTEDFLNEHIKTHVERPYLCTLCNKIFQRGEHLIRHLRIHNDSQQPEPECVDQNQMPPPLTFDFKCSLCDKVFNRCSFLSRHLKQHLLKDKRHVCDVCNKAFARVDNLKTHQRIHTGQKDQSKLHLCIYCGKEFNNSSNMIVHMRRHTGERPYKCTVCGKGFPRSHDLKCHERTHSGERPYLCTLCGKSFNKSNKLVRHTRVHTGERPYVCNLCGRAFTQSNDLALHMRRHTGSRPYACQVCPARFIQSGQLKAHRRQQGHWVEQEIQFRGNRVEPVYIEGHVETPVKFRNKKIAQQQEEAAAQAKAQAAAQAAQAQQQRQQNHHLNAEAAVAAVAANNLAFTHPTLMRELSLLAAATAAQQAVVQQYAHHDNSHHHHQDADNASVISVNSTRTEEFILPQNMSDSNGRMSVNLTDRGTPHHTEHSNDSFAASDHASSYEVNVTGPPPNYNTAFHFTN